MKKFYVIDGNGYIHRAYHALPPLTTSTGEEVGALYGFMRMLNKILRQKAEYLAVCFDYPAPTFRHQEFAEYKATRKEIEPSLANQIPLAKEIARALKLTVFEKERYEADDLIATLAKKFVSNSIEIIIVSGDKDALQLVNEKILVLNEPKGILYNQEKVKEKYGVGAEQLPDVFGLAGDSIDNVPGVPGIGEKTAIRLIQQFGNIENLYANLSQLSGKIKENLNRHREDALFSKKLVTLDTNVLLDVKLEDCSIPVEPEREKLLTLLRRFEFASLVPEFMAERKEENLNYLSILEESKFQELVAKLTNCRAFSFDLETTHLDPLRAKIVGFSFSSEPRQASYVPVGHSYLGCLEQLSEEKVLDILKPILENPRIDKYGQNIKYDLLVLRRYGVNLRGVAFDTMVASYLLNPSKQNHNLGDIALEYLGERMTPIENLIGKGAKQTTIDQIEVEKVKDYSCADADTVLRLVSILKPYLSEKKLDKLFYDVEMPLLIVLAQMEENGIRIDPGYFHSLSEEFAQKMKALENKIHSLAGEEFNLNSPKQLSSILFEKLKLPVIRRTKTGISTDEEVLKVLSSMHELPRLILEYRELQKLKSTYADALIESLNPVTGRVHTSFNQAVTATGRLSSSNPNLQNIPIRTELGKKIRRGFIPEESWLFLSADYSQIDLRVLAHISKDPVLVTAFKNSEDIHNATASEIFGLAKEKITPELRRIAKTINFGIIYGMSAYGLSQQLNIPSEEAEKYINDYFAKYSGVKSWIEENLEKAREKGFVSTLFGRIRYLPEINSKNGQMRNFAERTAINTPIQGTAADIIKVAMIRISQELRAKSLRSRMLVQVHDELLFECPPEELEPLGNLVKENMEKAIRLDIPIVVDIKTGYNWRDLE